jgi:hypothetical protein
MDAKKRGVRLYMPSFVIYIFFHVPVERTEEEAYLPELLCGIVARVFAARGEGMMSILALTSLRYPPRWRIMGRKL